MTVTMPDERPAGPAHVRNRVVALKNPLRRFVLRRAAENRAEFRHHEAHSRKNHAAGTVGRNEAAVDSELAWLPLSK